MCFDLQYYLSDGKRSNFRDNIIDNVKSAIGGDVLGCWYSVRGTTAVFYGARS